MNIPEASFIVCGIPNQKTNLDENINDPDETLLTIAVSISFNVYGATIKRFREKNNRCVCVSHTRSNWRYLVPPKITTQLFFFAD